jgi:hypothetical protein
MGTSANNMTPAQINGIARSMVSAQSVRMVQQIFNATVVPANQPFLNVIPRNVGLIMGFWVKVVATITNPQADEVDLVPSDFGVANLLTQIQFTDLNNNVRIQTPGWHINFINSVKARFQYAASLLTSTMDGNAGIVGEYGANWPVIVQPASIPDESSAVCTMWYYIPLAYSDGDYRGAIYANVVNATMQLALTFNQHPSQLTSGDTTTACYVGATVGASVISTATVTVYQDYLDQLPFGKTGPILPNLDLSTVYDIKQTIFTGITQAQDFPMQYPNFRDFLSTFCVYNNGAGAASRLGGGDVAYFALQSANFTNLWKLEPALIALRTRGLMHMDFPFGVYYFGSRNKPISTSQYGNMELVLNASSSVTGAYALVGWESFALVNLLTQAGSLPAS